MLLSSQTEFTYDDSPSSNSPGPPAGDGSSGRGYRNTISEAVSGVTGFIGGLLRGNQNERFNDNLGGDSLRDKLRDIALETLRILDEGEYFPPGQDGPYDLRAKILWTEENTRYYGPDDGEGGEILESEFNRINEEGGDGGKEEEEERNKDGNMGAGEEDNDSFYLNEEQGENELEKATASAASKSHDDDNENPKDQTRVQDTVSPDPPINLKAALHNSASKICVGEYSTLVGARKVYLALARDQKSSRNKIGVLNFASAQKPGGGFRNGSQAQEESIARASTLFPSLITEDASPFYAHYHEDRGNAYYTHAMVYSPAVVLFRDDDGEWRSPVEVDVLTSAAVNAGEIRRELEKQERQEERLRFERAEIEHWKKRGEERRKEMAERQRQKEEREERQRQREEKKKAKEEMAKAKKEQANSAKLKKEMVIKNETDKGKAKDSGSEKEEPSDVQEKVVAKVGHESEENEKQEEVEVEKPEENQVNPIDSPDSGLRSDSDSQLKGTEENTESKGTLIQDDQAQPQAQPEAPPEVNQEPTSSSTIDHPLSLAQPEAPPEVNQELTSSSTIDHPLSLAPPTKPSQTPVPEPKLKYTQILNNAEIQIEQTMYARISRILHLFQLYKVPHLILGSFGTGVFKNSTELIAHIFADLLIKPGGRFKDVFETVVFAILGKETVRVFSDVFSRANKQAKKEKKSNTDVFVDSFGRGKSDGDVQEGDEEKWMRMMRWKERRRELERNSFMYDIPDAAADGAFFDSAHIDAASHRLPFHTAEPSAFSFPTSSASADAAFYAPSESFDASHANSTPYAASSNAFQLGLDTYETSYASFDAAQADAPYAASSNTFQGSGVAYKVSSIAPQDYYPPFFDATKASATVYHSFSTPALQHADETVQDNLTAVDCYGIPEDAEMLTRDDKQIDFVAEGTANAITPEAMVVDDGKGIEAMETKSLPTCSHEAQSSKADKKEDGDIDMQ